MVRIAVSDRGAGIPAAFRERIFRRFAQADGADSRRKGGTGLGLSICKTIVEEHGSRIWFETAEGAGTTFFVELPATV
jgi:signal transduction histidine kinase